MRRVYNAWLVLGGAAFLFCALRFYGAHRAGGGLFLAVLVLLCAYAVGGMVLSGLFSVGETKEMATPAAKIHGYGATFGFLALLFVSPLLALAAGGRGDTPTAVLCWTCFALALATFVLFVMADKPRFRGTPLANEGLWQRLTLLFMYLPVAWCAGLVPPG